MRHGGKAVIRDIGPWKIIMMTMIDSISVSEFVFDNIVQFH